MRAGAAKEQTATHRQVQDLVLHDHVLIHEPLRQQPQRVGCEVRNPGLRLELADDPHNGCPRLGHSSFRELLRQAHDDVDVLGVLLQQLAHHHDGCGNHNCAAGVDQSHQTAQAPVRNVWQRRGNAANRLDGLAHEPVITVLDVRLELTQDRAHVVRRGNA